MLTAKEFRFLIEPQYTFSRQLYNYRDDNFRISTGYKWRRFGKDGKPRPPVAVFTSRSGKCFIMCRTEDGQRRYRRYLSRTISEHICRRLNLAYGRRASYIKPNKNKNK